MNNIQPPDLENISYIDLWDKIVESKRHPKREKLEHYREKVKERYDFYASHTNSLDEILPLKPEEWQDIADELRGCYGNNATFRKTKKSILEQALRCPYCTLNRPNTLDHYFDKSHYPEYAVFIPNLVPCCAECNSAKGVNVFNEAQHRCFIHFYFDALPEYQFLFVRFTNFISDSVPQINLSLKFMPNESREGQIRTHFDKLNLLQKYKDAIGDRLDVVIQEIQATNPQSNSKEIIKHQYYSRIRHYGINYWETCMYEGILNSEGFIEHYRHSSG